MKLGEQYDKDDAFKKKARLYQSNYRANILNVDCDFYGNRLLDEDAELNYYQKLGVIEDLRKRYPKYSKKRDADMLRSEHIPFNIFSPLKLNLELAKTTFNKILGNIISEITKIEIEYAPKPKAKYLNDGTSFDTFIEFNHIDGSKGGIGIEVKYTEQAYSLGDTEAETIKNLDSIYYQASKKSELYIQNAAEYLIKDDFRQIWRNHILGERMKQNNEIKHFTSITLFPLGNSHFNSVVPKYLDLLREEKRNLFIPIHFEEFFEIYSMYNSHIEFKNWINYLKKRYLVTF